MSKSRDEVRADPQAFRAALARAREVFAKIDGVVSVGFGQKETAGAFGDVIAIVVVVSEKKPEASLAPSQRIPPDFEGYPTDVVVVRDPTLLACNNTTHYDVIRGGMQIAPSRPGFLPTSGGTLGCIVRRRGDPSRENVYLLTCRHVLYTNGCHEGHNVHQPAYSGELGLSTTLGPIQELKKYGNVSHQTEGMTAAREFFMDCATARIDIDSKCFDGSTCTRDHVSYATEIIDLAVGTDDPVTPAREDNAIADVRSVIDDPLITDQRVFKVGRTTGKTAGIVRRVLSVPNIPNDPDSPNPVAMTAHEMIEIDFDTTSTPDHVNCQGNERFAETGDSGAVVVDERRRVIGMVVAGAGRNDAADPPPRKHPTWACHILPVLDQLGICVPTTGGTSPGSCSARPAFGDFPIPDGQVLFAGAEISGAVVPPAIPVIPTTEPQRERLFALRDELRQTARGRTLHELFAELRREIGYLVRNHRRVKIAWHRHKGPAFLAHALKHLKGEAESIPREIAGVSRASFLTRMGQVLAEHGSHPLREAIERHGTDLLAILSDADTVQDCLAALRRAESNEVPA